MEEQLSERALGRYVDGLHVGDPIGHLNLTVVPVGGNGHCHLDYILAADAIAAGSLTVTEVDVDGSVSELTVTSTAEQMVLLLDGEELIGAKQNRILNTSVLLPPRAKTTIPVSCVEQGRWRHTSRQFDSGGYAPAAMRARKSKDVGRNLRRSGRADSDQSAVWEQVHACMAASSVPSPTMAMHDVADQCRDTLGAYVDALGYIEGSRGVIAAIGGRFVAMDLFDKPETLGRIWPRLITGYALDAMALANAKATVFSAKGAGAVLEHLRDAACQSCPTVGLGRDWRFETTAVVGQALIHEETCVHLSAFPNNDRADHGESRPGILPPSRRRRRRMPPGDVVD